MNRDCLKKAGEFLLELEKRGAAYSYGGIRMMLKAFLAEKEFNEKDIEEVVEFLV